MDHIVYRPDLSKEHIVNSHWALYCDNYLEGFHIPFVHKELTSFGLRKYKTEIDNYNLQIGYSKDGDDSFDFPKESSRLTKKIFQHIIIGYFQILWLMFIHGESLLM